MIDVTMPKLSDTMEEGKILRWAKREGDRVAIGEIIAEVETDKANMELEAYDEGTLAEVRVHEGESVPVGAVIAVLAGPGEKASAAPAKPPRDAAPAESPTELTDEEEAAAPAARSGGEEQPNKPKPADSTPKAVQEKPANAPREERAEAGRESSWKPTVVRRPEPADKEPAEKESVKASPLAKRLAKERGIDLRAIKGTGPGGRIVEKDVEAAPADGPTEAAERAAPAAPTGSSSRPTERQPAAPRRVELSRLRRTTAKRMAEAKREIPHFYASAEIAMDEAARMKDALAGLGGDYEGITFTHLVVKATGLALVRVPEVNASYDGDALIVHDVVNVGVATAVDDGLIVPVLHHCDREPLAAIVKQSRALVARARAGRFAGDDLSGGTFTVSNLGMFPVSEFAAVINPPQAAILAVGTIRQVGVVRDAQVVPGRVMTVTLSCDHRVIDGALAGRFLRELKALLEQPVVLLA